jgi:hypothetical protein
MTIHFDIPQDIEDQIRSAGVDPTQMAKELFLVDLYRKEQITHHQLAEALGLNRYETDGVLKRYGIGIELSLEEFRSQADSLRELRRQ